MSAQDIVPNEYVSVPAHEFRAYSQRHCPDGYVSPSLFAHVFLNGSARVGVALFVSYPRFVEDEPIFAYLSLACPYLARPSERWFKPGVCSPRTTWVKISCVHGLSPFVVNFADNVKLAEHCVYPAGVYRSAARPAVLLLERTALQDPDFGVFLDE